MIPKFTIADWQRMMAFVDKEDDCWVWFGKPANTGYGQIGWGKNPNRKVANPHKLIYEALIGKVPTGLTLDHKCRNRLCVNPGHLEPVTRGENVLRGESIPAQNARKTHCVHGHPFDEKNTSTYTDKQGYIHRQCLACHAIRNKNRRTS